MIHDMVDLKSFYPKKIRRAYPFGDCIGDVRLLTADATDFLPSRGTAQILVDTYLSSIDKVFPLLDPEQFKRELNSFWDAPKRAEKAWLARLFMVLAMGCYACPPLSTDSIAGGLAELARKCVDGAEVALLAEGRFMSKPNLTVLQTMLMIGIAKQMEIVTLDDSNGEWVYNGFLMRICMAHCLHMSAEHFEGISPLTVTMHQRMWTTMMLLSIMSAMEGGKTLLLQLDDFDASAIFQQSHRHPRPELSEEERYRQLVGKLVSVVLPIINKINSTHPDLDSNQSQQFEYCIKQLLQTVEITFPASFENGVFSASTGKLPSQRVILELILHRCLSSMHLGYFLNPDQCYDLIQSKQAIFDSAQELTYLQEKVQLHTSQKWIVNSYMTHFTRAGIYLSVLIGMDDLSGLDSGNPSKSAKEVAWECFRSCCSSSKDNLGLSIHGYKVFRGYTGILKVLEARETGESITDMLYKGGLEVITAVRLAHGMSPASASNYTPPDNQTAAFSQSTLETDFQVPPDFYSTNIDWVSHLLYAYVKLTLIRTRRHLWIYFPFEQRCTLSTHFGFK
jgi:hypothetical protein